MAIDLDCECGEHFRAAEALAGRTVACPACGLVVPVAPSTFRPASRASDRGVNGLGVAGVVVALLALSVCWLPIVGLHAVAWIVVGGVLSLVGLFVAQTGRLTGVGWPVAGMVLNLLAFVVMLVSHALYAEMAREAIEAGQREQLGAFDPPAAPPVFVPDPVPPAGPEPGPHPEPAAPAPAPAPAPATVVAAPTGPDVPGESLYDAMRREKGLPPDPRPDSSNADKEREAARAKSEADARAARAATILTMGRNLEMAGKVAPALENYRRVAKDFAGTPAARDAAARIKALTTARSK